MGLDIKGKKELLRTMEDLILKTFNEKVECIKNLNGSITIFFEGERKEFKEKLTSWLGDKIESIDYDEEDNDTFIYLK